MRGIAVALTATWDRITDWVEAHMLWVLVTLHITMVAVVGFTAWDLASR